jgi:hypothetical protein
MLADIDSRLNISPRAHRHAYTILIQLEFACAPVVMGAAGAVH